MSPDAAAAVISNMPPGTSATTYVLCLAVMALGTVIAVLWRKQDANEKATQEKLKECEADRNKLWDRLVSIEDKVG